MKIYYVTEIAHCQFYGLKIDIKNLHTGRHNGTHL